jgi:phosphoribosylformylglycinamidine (FGAM) synthase-like enzyme
MAATAWVAASWGRYWASRADTCVPDLDDPQDLVNLVNAINALRARGQILAYHDRSDGGLLATVAEMAFAGHVGVALNIDMLVTEGDGITDSRAEYGDAKNWAGQVSARREELTLKALFSEELGVVLQVATVRAQRRDADPARARPVQAQPLHRQDAAPVVRLDPGPG